MIEPYSELVFVSCIYDVCDDIMAYYKEFELNTLDKKMLVSSSTQSRILFAQGINFIFTIIIRAFTIITRAI